MSRIEATGSYLPKTVVPNDYFAKGTSLFESINEFFTGFKERRHASPEESGLEMAVYAAQDALEKSQYTAGDIDLIIGIIQPSEHVYGDDLNLIQHRIGAWSASVLPINTGCSSFLSAINLADSLIKTGKNKKILIVSSANWVNTGLDKTSEGYAFAGDGAGAIIVDAEGDSFIDINQANNTTPEVFESMVISNPIITGKKEFFRISPPESISATKDLIMFPVSIAKSLLDRNSDIKIDKFLTHQSGLKMMHMWAEKLQIPSEKIRHTLDTCANMIAANIPVSLNHWVSKGDIVRGDTILFFAPSAGGHHIAILWKY